MKQVVATGPELSMDERNVLSVAYKNKADHLLTVICCHSTWIWYDLIWFVCEWTLMDFGFDVIWLCSSFLTCMRAQTHLQVHRNFVQMQLVLVLMINNLWGFSWLIKLPSQPPCTQRHLATPCSSILIPFYISNVLHFKPSKTLGQVGMLRSAFRATSVASSKTASREEVEYAEEYKKKARTQWTQELMHCSFTPLYCGMSGVCSEFWIVCPWSDEQHDFVSKRRRSRLWQCMKVLLYGALFIEHQGNCWHPGQLLTFLALPQAQEEGIRTCDPQPC